MEEKKSEFKKVSVREEDKREFAILCATIDITEVDAFTEMLKLYKAVIGKPIKSRDGKKNGKINYRTLVGKMTRTELKDLSLAE